MDITNENLMTPRQVAALVGVSRRCIQFLCKQSKLNHWVIGGRYLVDYQAALDYFHRNNGHFRGRKPRPALLKE